MNVYLKDEGYSNYCNEEMVLRNSSENVLLVGLSSVELVEDLQAQKMRKFRIRTTEHSCYSLRR